MFHTQSRTGRTRATAVRQTAQKALAAEEAVVKVRYGCLTWQMREARHLSYAWGLKCVHPAQKAGLRRYNTASGPGVKCGPTCRISAITACGEIYSTPLGKVKLGDLKTQFEAYLAAADINDGAIPDDTEVKVASRLKIFDANSHESLGFAYAHPNINGRTRYAGPTRAGGLAGAVSQQKLPFQNSWLQNRFSVLLPRCTTREENSFCFFFWFLFLLYNRAKKRVVEQFFWPSVLKWNTVLHLFLSNRKSVSKQYFCY